MAVRSGWKPILIAVCCTWWAVALQADPKESYKAGQEALQGERWPVAERFFSEAIAERAEERFNALLGRRYFPHYYLGVARSEQGKCSQAYTAFSESERQGKLQKVPELLQDLKRRRQTCQEQQAEVARRAAVVTELLDQATDGFETLDYLAQNDALATQWNEGSPSFAQRNQQTRQQESQLRQQLAAARDRENSDDLKSVERLADKLLEDIEKVITDARTELGDRNAAAASALSTVEDLEVKARRQLRSIKSLAPYPRELGRRVKAVETLLANILASKDKAQANQLARFESELEAALQQLTRASRQPPDVLKKAVESFLASEYQTVLDTLEEATFRGNQATAQVCLLRAASRFHLFTLGGEEAIELEAAAIEDLRECAAKDSLSSPSERFFSPRFRSFFTQAMAPEALDSDSDLDSASIPSASDSEDASSQP